MRTFLFIIFCLFTVTTFAQQNADSVAYEAQRNKVNEMLDRRSTRFGEYDESLEQRTGIFGLQTKSDIRRSNDILMDIVNTDNEIFHQIKILLDYRVFQQTQAQTQVKEMENARVAFMNSINRLRNQVQEAKKAAEEAQKEADNKAKLVNLLFVVIALMTVSILVLIRFKGLLKI